MKQNMREKALRIIASSILTSDLTVADIRTISRSFIRGDDFTHDLGILVKEITNNLSKYSINLMKSNFDGDDFNSVSNINVLLHDAMNIVKNKRLSKATILDLIRMISPNDSIIHERNKTTKELLADFFDRRPEDGAELVKLLTKGHGGDDEYLKGIMNKRYQ